MKPLKFALIIITLLSLTNCEKDAEVQSKDYPYVLTLTPFVYENSVKLIADISNLGDSEIVKCGFVLSTESAPTKKDNIILLDEKASKGTYSYTVKSGLEEGQVYYVRAYILTEQYEVYGIEKFFISQGSLAPIINDFEPKQGPIGTKVIIKGENFALFLEDNSVTFGNTKAAIDSVSESQLIITLPNITKACSLPITVETAGKQTTSLDTFDLWFPWLQKNDRKGEMLSSSAYFSIDQKGYIISSKSTTLLEYNPVSDAWNEEINLPENSGEVPLAFTANENVYILLQNHFWEFNPQSNSWLQRDDFPGSLYTDTRYNFGMSVNNNIYIGNCYKTYELWEYNTVQNIWVQKADFTGNFERPVFGNYSFTMNGYAFLGVNFGTSKNTLWQYNPEQDQWTSKTAPPLTAYNNHCTITIEDDVFVGVGSKFTGSTYNNVSNEILKYDVENDTWLEYYNCPVSMAAYASFSINNKGYVIGGMTNSYKTTNDVWELDPTKN